MIIVEGPDGSGKTTLANELASQLGVPYQKPPESVLSSTQGPLSIGLVNWWDQTINLSPRAVFDRCFYISDGIYRMISKKPPLITHERHVWQLQTLVNKQPFVVFCLPSFDEVLANLRADRPQLEGVGEEESYLIYWQYHIFATLWKEIHYNDTIIYNRTNADDVYVAVADYARRYWR